jgi:hypothetical protein
MEQYEYVIAKINLSLLLKHAYNMYRSRQGWTPASNFYCRTVHFDNVQNSFRQQMHPLLDI